MLSGHILNDTETKVAYFVIAVYTVIVVLQILLLWVWIDVRRGPRQSEMDDFSILVILADLFSGLSTVPTICIVVFRGGYQDGPFLCDFQGAQLFFSHMISLFCVMLYAVSCNQRIVHNKSVQLWKAITAILFVSVFVIILGSIKPVGFNLHQLPSEAGYYCVGDFTVHSGPEFYVNLVGVAFLSTLINVILYMYYGIRLKVLEVMAVSKSDFDSDSNIISIKDTKPGAAKNHRVVKELSNAARRSALVPLVYVVCWSPYLLCLCYQLISGYYIPAWLDQVVTIFAAFNCIGDFIVFGIVNGVYRKSMFKILGFKPTNQAEQHILQ